MTGAEYGTAVDVVPIAPHQQEIWRFARRHPSSPAHNMPEVFTFEGEFDLAAADGAMNALIRRHDALRTTFHRLESGDVQVIDHAPGPSTSAVVDLRCLQVQDQSAQAEATVQAAIQRPFDLSAERPIRLTIVRLEDHQTLLVLVAHHIACDGLSMSIVLREFRACYLASRRGVPPDLGPNGLGYEAFTRAALAALENGSLDRSAAYWRSRLLDVVGVPLPGTPTLGVTPYAQWSIPIELESGVTDQLLSVARAERSTPFAVLLGAMHVVFAAAGIADVALRTATSGRTEAFAQTVGMVSNTVISRSQIDLAETFADALAEVWLDLMDALDHQDLPFSQLAHTLGGAEATRVDSIRTEFTAGVVGQIDLGEGSLTNEVRYVDEGPLDLVVNCHLEPHPVALDWAFARGVYSRSVAEAYTVAYHDVLTAVLRHPHVSMESLGVVEAVDHVVRSTRPEGGAATGLRLISSHTEDDGR